MESLLIKQYQKIKSHISLLISNSQSINYEEFTIYNNRHLLKRLNIISATLVIIYIYYFIADFILLRDIDNLSYRYNLIVIHFLSLFTSIIYLFIYQNIKSSDEFLLSKKPTFLINVYIVLYAFLGVATSLNSQTLTGNIDSYITIIIGIAVLLHFRPLYLFFTFLSTQVVFTIGLSMTSQNSYEQITKQINSTTTVMVAFLISFAFYTYRKNAFFNRIQLKEQEDNFKKLFEINPFPLVLTSAQDGRIIEVNNRALEFYGVAKDEIHLYRAEDFYKSNEERRPIIEELRRTGHVKNHIIEQKVMSGEFKWVLLNYELIEYGNEKCILTGVTDVTDLKKIEAELVQHASIDILTGIYNRRSGLQLLEQLLHQSKQENSTFILCFIDVNNLKVVNDKFGHTDGDYLIKRTCQIIKQYVKEDDIFFRYGGDEFIIAFPERELQDVKGLWDQMVRHLSTDHLRSKKPFPISVSHGLFEYTPDHDISLEDMIECADQEMYREKLEIKKVLHV